MSSPEQRLASLGLELPEAPPPAGAYLQAKRDGDLLHLAGHGPFDPRTDSLITGKVGTDVSPERAHEAARLTGLQMLATINAAAGSLSAVASVVRLLGMVNVAPGFDNTPAVINGCSELFLEVFGDEVGAHVRSAIGVAQLPFGICVEVEGIVRLR